MGMTESIATFIAKNGVTRCAPEASGKVAKGEREIFGGNVGGHKRPKSTRKRPASPHIDTSVKGWQWSVLAMPAVLDAVKSGVYAALVGSHWATDADTVSDMISNAKTKLAASYLDSWDNYDGAKTKNTIEGFCRYVSYQKTCNYIALHVHKHDGAVNAMRIDATDATAEDSAPRVVTDETSALAYLRVDQRQRLTSALDALDASEREHFNALISGRTSAEFATSAGMTPVQATRQKSAMVAKLTVLVNG